MLSGENFWSAARRHHSKTPQQDSQNFSQWYVQTLKEYLMFGLMFSLWSFLPFVLCHYHQLHVCLLCNYNKSWLFWRAGNQKGFGLLFFFLLSGYTPENTTMPGSSYDLGKLSVSLIQWFSHIAYVFLVKHVVNWLMFFTISSANG